MPTDPTFPRILQTGQEVDTLTILSPFEHAPEEILQGF